MEPTQQQLGKRIVELRKRKGYSQEDLAKVLGISRSSVTQLELGNRNLSALELIKLSRELGFSLDKFSAKEYNTETETPIVSEPVAKKTPMRISVTEPDLDKFRNILLYILERCGGKPNVGETVLYKLLYFADFNHYEVYETHMTGAEYRKLPYGPVPQKIEFIVEQMIKNGQLQRIKTKFHGYPQTRFIPLSKPDLTILTAAEKDVIDRVIDRFSDWTAASISAYSHKDMPWLATDDGETIDYELAFYREAPYSARTYDETPELP